MLDKPYPSRLLLGSVETKPLHVVLASDEAAGLSIVVTVYEPVLEHWNSDFRNEEDEMSCAICRNGTTHSGTVTVTLQRGETTVILKQVPAEVCDNCGEYYLSSEVPTQVLERAESAIGSGDRSRNPEICRLSGYELWLGGRDSNPDKQLQRLPSYR